jgi:hypothetical protein
MDLGKRGWVIPKASCPEQSGNHPYGARLVATIQINTPKGRSQPIATVWLVRFNENTARFITAFPAHSNQKP